MASKFEKEVEIKTPALVFYKIFKSQCHHIPNLSPEKIHTIHVHEGDWESAGSVKHWKYNLGGDAQIFQEKVEVDDEKKAVTFIAVGGHILEQYKSYKGTFKVTPKGDDQLGGLVTITLEYEKIKEDDHDPIENYMDFLVSLVEDIDANLVKTGTEILEKTG
ncbi:hypothetical protein UlMin_040837 [Ulmus minor]